MKKPVPALVEHEGFVGDDEAVALDQPSLVDRRDLAAVDIAVVAGAALAIVGPAGRCVVRDARGAARERNEKSCTCTGRENQQGTGPEVRFAVKTRLILGGFGEPRQPERLPLVPPI